MGEPTLTNIAVRINAHLKRLERDPKANAPRPHRDMQVTPFYGACAWRAGARVGIRYVAYQGDDKLTRDDAENYLAWLDAGNVGKHWDAARTPAQQKEPHDGKV